MTCVIAGGRVVAPWMVMSLLKIGILILAALVLIGCKKADDIADSFTHFGLEADYVVAVPASPVTALPVDIITKEIATHSDVAFSANKTRADLVQKITLTDLILSVKSPEGGMLTFLKSVDIYARAEGLPEVRVAYKDVVPGDVGDTLALDVTGADLTEYFKKTKYQLRITVTSDEVVMQDYEINAHGKFAVDAKLVGGE